MTIIERKNREKAEMRKLILEAAMELFVKEGYNGISIRKIAEKIEYSPGSIYTYFSDKDSIFYALHIEGFELFYKKQVVSQSINDPRERLAAHAKAYIEFALEHPEYYNLMFILRAPINFICKRDKVEWSFGQRSFDLLVRNVSECQAVGYFKNQEAVSVAFLLWSTVHGISSLILRRGDAMEKFLGPDSNAVIDELLGILTSMIK